MLSNDCMETLKISFENSKLKGIWHYSLPSGYTCPGASMCKTFCNVNTGKIVDKQTPDANGMTYRCYAATDEARYPSVRKSRWHNFDLLRGKTQEEMVEVITRSIMPRVSVVAAHFVCISVAITSRKNISMRGWRQPQAFHRLCFTLTQKASISLSTIFEPMAHCLTTSFSLVLMVASMMIRSHSPM